MTSPVEAGFGVWSVKGHPLKIEYSLPVLEEISAAAVDGLCRFRHGGVEIGGVLFGTVRENLVRVLAYRPLECEYAFGPRFVLSDRDRAQMKALLDVRAGDCAPAGLQPVGWYHSHTRSDISLSLRDLEIYDRLFPKPGQIALVLAPHYHGPARAGFFFRSASGSVRADSSYREFDILPRRRLETVPEADPEPVEGIHERLVPAEADPEPPEAEDAGEPAPEEEPAQEVAAPQIELPLPSFALMQAPSRGGKRKWLVLGALLCVAMAIGAERYYRLTAPEPPLSLWVADLGGQLLIEWDRTARPVRQARAGSLEILDGGERTEVQMDGDRLREGSVDYVRRSEMVDVRLRVERAGGGSVQELIRFIGQPVRRPPSAEEAEAVRERDQLKVELEKLRTDLARRDALIRRLRAEAAR